MPERSHDVFERVVGFEDAETPPLPPLDAYEDLARHSFVTLTPASRKILDAGLRAMGYPAFHATLATSAEPLMRGTNMRVDRLFAPVYTATAVLADDPRSSSAIDRAAAFAVAARSLAEDVLEGTLSQDEHKGAPLEMGQYPNLFATSTVVEGKRARLFKSTRRDRLAIVVRRRIYTLALGETPSVADVRASLDAIVAHASARPLLAEAEAPGTLSAADKKTFLAAFQGLEATNAAELAELRDCLAVLCLDLDTSPAGAPEAGELAQVKNVANRWYVQSLQIVVSGNAKVAVMFSFPSYIDGNVMMRGAGELFRRAAASSVGGEARPLPWKAIELRVDRALAARALDDVRAVTDSQRHTWEIGIGRRFFQERQLDPVQSFVAALALATYRTTGSLPNVLQLVTASRFRCLPVGGAVVTTPEMRAFVEAPSRATLGPALASQAREGRAERARLSLRWTIEGFIRTRRGPARARALAAFAATMTALKARKLLPAERIILSHPEIAPETALFGRPGVRLPYVTHYGLHYLMYPDRTLMTFMPGLRFRVANATLAREIERAARAIGDMKP